MSLQQEVASQIKQAMLAKDSVRVNTLRMLKSAIDYTALELKKDQLEDTEVLKVIQKESKKRKDSIEQFEKGGRHDLVEKEKAEDAILEAFLPKQLSSDEVTVLVKEAISETGASSKKEMGIVMKSALEKAAGRADGKAISAAVGRLLK